MPPNNLGFVTASSNLSAPSRGLGGHCHQHTDYYALGIAPAVWAPFSMLWPVPPTVGVLHPALPPMVMACSQAT